MDGPIPKNDGKLPITNDGKYDGGLKIPITKTKNMASICTAMT
jgi:hypothetical protein